MIELRLLQYYLVVIREGNISKAADVLHVTQPTLSRQMRQLEEEPGAAGRFPEYFKSMLPAADGRTGEIGE